MNESSSRFDEVFMGLASQHGGIESLLQTFFSFLHRKTDFYVVTETPANMGFPPGIAEKIVSGYTYYCIWPWLSRVTDWMLLQVLKVFRSFPYKSLQQQQQQGSSSKGSSSTGASTAAVGPSPPSISSSSVSSSRKSLITK